MEYLSFIFYYTVTLFNLIIFFRAWKNREYPYGQVTMYLAELFCILYFFQHFFPDFTALFSINNQFSITEIYRFLTANFLHFSFLHLIINVISIILIGSIFEEKYGSKNLILIFILGGFVTYILRILFIHKIGMGSGGSIFVILGFLMASGVDFHYKKTIIFLNSITSLSSIYFIINFNNFEHLIGFLLGYYLIFYLYKKLSIFKYRVI